MQDNPRGLLPNDAPVYFVLAFTTLDGFRYYNRRTGNQQENLTPACLFDSAREAVRLRRILFTPVPGSVFAVRLELGSALAVYPPEWDTT